MIILDDKNTVKVFYDSKTLIMHHEWFNYDPDITDQYMINVLDKIYVSLKDTQSKKILVLANKTKGCFTPSIQDFINKIQFPRFADSTQLKYVAIILDRNDPKSKYSAVWETSLETFKHIQIRHFINEIDALKWLKTVE